MPKPLAGVYDISVALLDCLDAPHHSATATSTSPQAAELQPTSKEGVRIAPRGLMRED